jgi:Papain fold toxin 1, glutamine deamidase
MPAVMAEWARRSAEPATMADMATRLRELGSGSSAVVGFNRADAPGHWFNAVNHEGTVLAVDGQSARFEDWLPTTGGSGFDEKEMSYSDAI